MGNSPEEPPTLHTGTMNPSPHTYKWLSRMSLNVLLHPILLSGWKISPLSFFGAFCLVCGSGQVPRVWCSARLSGEESSSTLYPRLNCVLPAIRRSPKPQHLRMRWYLDTRPLRTD